MFQLTTGRFYHFREPIDEHRDGSSDGDFRFFRDGSWRCSRGFTDVAVHGTVRPAMPMFARLIGNDVGRYVPATPGHDRTTRFAVVVDGAGEAVASIPFENARRRRNQLARHLHPSCVR